MSVVKEHGRVSSGSLLGQQVRNGERVSIFLVGKGSMLVVAVWLYGA